MDINTYGSFGMGDGIDKVIYNGPASDIARFGLRPARL